MTIPNLPNIPEEDQTPLVKVLLAYIDRLTNAVDELTGTVDELTNTVALLKEENQLLKNEIAMLKGQKPKPKIPPSILEGPKSKDKDKTQRGKHPRQMKTNKLQIHNVERVKPESIPEGAIFKGYKKYTVQDIILESRNTVFELERWQLSDGTYVSGKLPSNIRGHYGPKLVTFILCQYYGCRVTEPLLIDQLREMGVLISSGQLNNILVEHNDAFHAEKNKLLQAGIAATNQIQVDDTGARHSGKNGYATVLGNEYFTFVKTTNSKSRINFLQILHGTKPQYLINEHAGDYIETLRPRHWLRGYLILHAKNKALSENEWNLFLKDINITSENEVRLATESAIFASLISKGIPRNLGVHVDDAGQFNAFIRSLCWIHEERHYRKIIPSNDIVRAEIEVIRDGIWDLYKGLKDYKVNPTEDSKLKLDKQFNTLFTQKTSSQTLNKQLNKTFAKKEKLLRVLEIPKTPLHNNGTETDVREFVVKRKISGGTRSNEGKICRDTFISLKKTCIKLGYSFRDYIEDRISRTFEIPPLSEVIAIKSSLKPVGL